MRTVLATLLLIAPLAAGPGLPACSGPGRELAHRGGFVLCHDASLKTAVWTAYDLTPADLGAFSPRSRRFRRDDALAGAAFDTDYRNSGYSRGHLVPASDQAASPETTAATFLLSNAVPMPISLNAGRWRQLEIAVRRLAAHSDRLTVLTGPVFCEQVERIGTSGVAVPCRLFKVILAERDGRLQAYAAILPNSENPPESLDHFAVSVDAVEHLTGLDFFPSLAPPVQTGLESTAVPIDVTQ